jgi:hypothetical protein
VIVLYVTRIKLLVLVAFAAVSAVTGGGFFDDLLVGL